jgi:hypothetical protein
MLSMKKDNEMQLDNLMVSPGSDIYYDDKFRATLESFMTFFRTDSSTSVKLIPPMDAYKFEFDLSGLLSNYNIPVYMHWIIMRVNKMTNPSDLTKETNSLLIPSETTVEYIRQSFMSTQRLN